jgi:hypothetical protein
VFARLPAAGHAGCPVVQSRMNSRLGYARPVSWGISCTNTCTSHTWNCVWYITHLAAHRVWLAALSCLAAVLLSFCSAPLIPAQSVLHCQVSAAARAASTGSVRHTLIQRRQSVTLQPALIQVSCQHAVSLVISTTHRNQLVTANPGVCIFLK